jgi:hypothetical protein
MQEKLLGENFLEAAVLELGVRCMPKGKEVFVLDFDATDDPLHGGQEGRFFHGYYGNYCYLPLFCFCGDVPLWAQLRTSDHDASTGTVEALEKSSRPSGRIFPMPKCWCVPTRGFRASRSWRGARGRGMFITSSAWRAMHGWKKSWSQRRCARRCGTA